MSVLLRTEGVHKSYGGVQALDACTVQIEEGTVAGDDVEQRGLAGSVRADQPGYRALLDLDRACVQGLDAAVGLVHALGPQ